MTVEIYEDATGDQRWRITVSNQKVIAEGAEAYSNQKTLNKALDRLFESIQRGDFKVIVHGKKSNWPL